MLHFGLVALLAVLCSTPSLAAGGNGPTSTARKGGSKSEPMTLRACEAGALALEEAVRALDEKAFEAAVDWETLLARAGEHVPAVERTRKSFRDEALASIRALCADVVATSREHGSFRFERVRETKDSYVAVFRLVRDGESGFDRLELAYDRKKPAGAPAGDLESALDAAPWSRKLRDLFVLTAAEQRDVAGKLRGREALLATYAGAVSNARAAFQCGENRRALDLVGSLPGDLAADPSLLVLRLLASRSISGVEFERALAAARELAPRTAAFELVAIDHYYLQGRVDELLQSLATLDAAFGGDAWIDHLSANAWRARGDLSKARELARRAIERESTLEEPYWTLFEIFVDERRFEDAVGMARKIDASFDVDWREIERAPALAELVASSTWVGWRSTVANRR